MTRLTADTNATVKNAAKPRPPPTSGKIARTRGNVAVRTTALKAV
jgi:hypothetical protein